MPGWVKSTTPPRSGPTSRRSSPGRSRRPASPATTSRPSASPTSARPPSSGTRTPVSPSTTPSSGRTPAPTPLCRELGRNVGQDRFRRETGLPGLLLRRPEGPLAARQRRRPARARRGGRPALRHHGHLGHLEPDRRGERRQHVTDVTNASRTMLMNLQTMQWDEKIAESIGVPTQMLPEIRSSAEVYGEITGGRLGDLLGGIPVASALGDQQAALFGQTCFSEGETKSTYGTGNLHGDEHRRQAHQLLLGPADHGRLQDRRPGHGLRPGGLNRRHRVRWCSGCATRWA